MLKDQIVIDDKLGNRIKESHIKNNYNSEWVKIIEFSNKYNFNNLKWTQKVFNYMFDIKQIPKCICGNNRNFRGRLNNIYTKYCSNKCASLDNAKERMIIS